MLRVGLTARDIMKSPVITVNEQTAVEEVCDLFVSKMISGAPVVDDDGKLVGVVALKDIVQNEPRREHIVSERVAADNIITAWQPQFSSEELTGYHLEESETMAVKDIMTPFVYRVDEDTLAKDVAEIMVSARIHRLFVSCGEKITGVISALDMLSCYSGNNHD